MGGACLGDGLSGGGAVGGRPVLPMTAGNQALSASLEHGMGGDLTPLLEDVHLAGQRMHLDGAFAGAVGHAVEIAADGDHAVTGDAPLQPQYRLERPSRQRLETGALIGEMGRDDMPRGGVHAGGVGQGSGREAVGMPTEGLASSSSHRRSCWFRSSRWRKLQARKKSWRMVRNGRSTLPLLLAR